MKDIKKGWFYIETKDSSKIFIFVTDKTLGNKVFTAYFHFAQLAPQLRIHQEQLYEVASKA